MGLSWGRECWGALRTPQPEGRREQLIDLFSIWLENCAFNPLVKTIAGHCGVMEKTGGKGGSTGGGRGGMSPENWMPKPQTQ